jgi:hypothetical protein
MAAPDAALNMAFGQMSASDRATYLAGQASTLQSTLTGQFADSFGQSLANTQNTARNFDIMTNYTTQSNNLNTVVKDLAGTQDYNMSTAKRNSDTAQRNQEIKEWYYNNKLDTLFVFQLIFISLCVLAAIAFAAKMGFISNTLVGVLIGFQIVVIILIISNRAIYTEKVRNKRYWNKRIYGVVGSPLPGGIQKCK